MSKTLGKIIQIVGVVVDVEFPRDVKLPAIYDALHVKNGKETLMRCSRCQLRLFRIHLWPLSGQGAAVFPPMPQDPPADCGKNLPSASEGQEHSSPVG